MHRLSIGLLGPFQATLDGAPVSGFAYTKVRALLAYLAIEAERPQTRAYLAALLWPDVAERLARQNLSQALTMLRNILGDRSTSGAGAPFLLVTADTIQLSPLADCMVDVTRFSSLLAMVEAHQHRQVHVCMACIQRLRQAIALYRGHLLVQLPSIESELFDEWAQTLRERLRQQAIGALERLIRAAEWREDYDLAIGYARRQVGLDPRFESSYRELMRLLALAGRPGEALARYEQLRVILAEERGVRPEPETIALHERIRELTPAARGSLRRSPARPGNLPAPPMQLLGRSPELETICARLREGSGRILTIVSPPGSDRTCLALEAAHALRFDFADGVFIVDLAPLADSAHALPAIGRIVPVRPPLGLTWLEALIAYLHKRHLLLMLDGFEHVLDAAPAVAALLAACPEVSVLATSSAPLRVRAECRYYLAETSAAAA
jgi:DNA-binding SARP family transcriptional activator